MNDPQPRSSPPGSDKASNAHRHSGELTGNWAHSAPGADPTTPRSPVPPAPGAFPQIDGYRVVEKIGEGGMGAVYLAEDEKLGRKVAIKTMRPELTANRADRDRFVREARAAAAVEHDHIVPIWHVGESTDGTPCIVMPFLRGELLHVRLKREPVAPEWLILKVAREVAAGLAAAHAEGLIHRDIKPGNIWLEGDPAAAEPGRQVRLCKILDFGLARSVDRDDTQITSTGAVLGTPAYMAPEQARGEKVDHRADLFSLGVMLYRMSTGHAPFRGPTAMSVLIAAATERPEPLSALRPDLPPELVDLIDRLMQKDPGARPQSADEVARWVEGTGNTGPAPVPVYVLPAPAPNPWEDATEPDDEPATRIAPAAVGRSRRVWMRRPWVLAGTALGLLVLAALVAAVVIRVDTGEGTLTVEITDPDVEARIRNGMLVLYGPDGKERYRIAPAERDKKLDPGAYTIRVEGADGLSLDTREFTLKKGDKVTVRVTLDPKVVGKKADSPANVDADRKAVVYALSVGGAVRVNGENQYIDKAKDLPAGPLRFTGLSLNKAKSTAEGLRVFDGCTNLTLLSVYFTPLGDAGIAHFKNCKNLQFLWLIGADVGDAGMAHFAGCTTITDLNLSATRVTDAGLAHFKGCKGLTGLHLNTGGVGDTGLALFKGCVGLKLLNLRASKVTNEGLAYFKDCPGLSEVDLGLTGITEAGVEHLKHYKSLTRLELDDTAIGDAALDTLKECKALTSLNLKATKVTAEGVAKLSKALPKCKIAWDGATIEPTEK
jgi:serine/threonine protein kinase